MLRPSRLTHGLDIELVGRVDLLRPAEHAVRRGVVSESGVGNPGEVVVDGIPGGVPHPLPGDLKGPLGSAAAKVEDGRLGVAGGLGRGSPLVNLPRGGHRRHRRALRARAAGQKESCGKHRRERRGATDQHRVRNEKLPPAGEERVGRRAEGRAHVASLTTERGCRRASTSAHAPHPPGQAGTRRRAGRG